MASLGCTAPAQKVSLHYWFLESRSVQVSRAEYGISRAGQVVYKYRLTNDLGMSVELITYGGRVTAVRMPSAHRNLENVVLGFDDLASYEQDSAYLGALVGRYANRIGGASFSIEGKTYQLSANEGDNQLHGGHSGLHNRVFQAEAFEHKDEVGVELSALLEDRLEGFPGNLSVRVRISLNSSNELKFDYQAMCDEPTHVNLTHHGYFNLAGADSGSCMGHELWLDADRYTPVDSQSIPTGEQRAVSDTVFDFRQAKSLGADSGAPVGEPGGFDHNFVLNQLEGEFTEIARLSDPVSGRSMLVSTTQPGVQLYTAQYLDSSSVDGRVRFAPYAGVCLETQHFANSPNQSGFPSTLLMPSAVYRQSTIYAFEF